MKKFSKMLALGLAAALVFGVAAQAAESPSAGDSEVSAEVLKDAAGVSNTVVVNGEEVTVEFEVPQVLEETKLTEVKTTVATVAVVSQVKEAVKKSVTLSADQTLTLVGEPKIEAAFELQAPKGLNEEQIKAGVQVPFTLKEGVKDNMLYSVIHFLADGSCEVLPATVRNGVIYATFTSFSPVVIVAQEVKVDTNAPAQDGSNSDSNNSSNNGSQNQAVAPKTGEVVPVAGVMAFVLMAGAVFCAKKARYNR